MSIRPIDLQVLIPRATEVGKAQQVADQQSINQQQQFAEQWQKISDSRQQKVQNTPKSEGGKVHRDSAQQQNQEQEANHQNFSDERPQEPEQQSNQASNSDPVRGHVIDIKM